MMTTMNNHVPPLADDKLEAMIAHAVAQPQIQTSGKVVPFVRAMPWAGATMAAAMLLVAVLYNPTTDPKPHTAAFTDEFFMDYTTLEMMDGI